MFHISIFNAQKGNADAPSKDQMECPDGWQWISEWEVDTNRAVDALGIPPKSFTNLTGYRYFKFTGIDFSNICYSAGGKQ